MCTGKCPQVIVSLILVRGAAAQVCRNGWGRVSQNEFGLEIMSRVCMEFRYGSRDVQYGNEMWGFGR